MSRPILTLLTDFGLAGHYVAAMKGVILGICPDAQIVDISHEIECFSILEGAYTLGQAWSNFSIGTVHVAVVDPGVGSARRPILVESGGHVFIGPDNGLFGFIFETGDFLVREIRCEQLFRHPVSQTFHGRDIFAPVAAHVAAGFPIADVGNPVHDPIRLAGLIPVKVEEGVWEGQVLSVDHFGNVITSFRWDDYLTYSEAGIKVLVGTMAVHRFAANYSDMTTGGVYALKGSSGYLEISKNKGNAAEFLGVNAGTPAIIKKL